MPRTVRKAPAPPAASTEIDARALNCPMPVFLLRKALDRKPRGHEVIVHVTDPAATKDFEKYCRNSGDTVTKIVNLNNYSSIHVRKA